MKISPQTKDTLKHFGIGFLIVVISYCSQFVDGTKWNPDQAIIMGVLGFIFHALQSYLSTNQAIAQLPTQNAIPNTQSGN